MRYSTILVTMALASASGMASAQESDLAYRLGMTLGGAYASNVFGNASSVDDVEGLARLALDADWGPTSSSVVKLAYRGDLDVYRDVSSERHLGHLADLTLGLRPAELVYLTLGLGGELVRYARFSDFVEDSPYDFQGGFAHAAARFELGESTTLRAGYRLRRDEFPSYDLDNTSHTVEGAVSIALGDTAELIVPVAAELATYSERFLLDAAGLPTGERRENRRLVAEPRLSLLPTFSTRYAVGVRAEYNDSNDSYAYTGPFGSGDPLADPELIRHFDSYAALGGFAEARLQPAEKLLLGLRAAGGVRRYSERPAFDSAGEPTADLARDVWSGAELTLELHVTREIVVSAGYSYLRQWSNDPLWDYDAHRVQLATTLGFGE